MRSITVVKGRVVSGGFGFDKTEGGKLLGRIELTTPSSSTKWGSSVFELNLSERGAYSLGKHVVLVRRKLEQLQREKRPNLVIGYARDERDAEIYLALGWNEGRRRKPSIEGFYINGEYYPRRTCNSKWDTSSKVKLPEKLDQLYGPGRKKVKPRYDNGKRFFWMALTEKGLAIIKAKKDHYLPPTKEFLS